MDKEKREDLSKKDPASSAKSRSRAKKPVNSEAQAKVPAAKEEKTKVVAKAEPEAARKVVAQAGKDKQKAAAKVGKAEVEQSESQKPARSGKSDKVAEPKAQEAKAQPAAAKAEKGAKAAPAKAGKAATVVAADNAHTADKKDTAAKAEKPATGAGEAKPARATKAAKAGKGVAESGFKPAEAFLEADEAETEAGGEVEFELGPDGKPVLGPDGKPKAKAKPRFKKTSKVDELLEVDESLGELPPTYDEDRAVLLVRDPQWAYAYWDLRKALATRDPNHGDYRQILRVQEMSGHDGRPAYFYDVPVPPYARSWYLKLPGDGRRYRIEVGLHYRDGSYSAVAASNAIEMPRSKPSEVVADKFVTLPLEEPELPPQQPHAATSLPPVAEWMVAPESAGAVASVAPPLAPVAGQPAPTFEPSVPAAGWEEAQIRPWAHPWSGRHPFTLEEGLTPGAPGLSGPVSSHSISSWGFAPGASEQVLQPPKAKDFWLVADAELIVYGATEPDAKVTLRGERIQLRPDGTFSFRFYLPDGLHPIPIRALNADEDDERMITITVSRGTEGDGKTNLRNL